MNRNASGVAQADATVGESPTTAITVPSRPASWIVLPEERQRVHLADGGVDEVGLVPLPARLVLLGAAVVVDGEQHPAERLRAAAPR